jgi:hypothetical protein
MGKRAFHYVWNALYTIMMRSHHNRYPINFNTKEISMNIYVGNLSYEVTEGEKYKAV